MRIEVSVVFEWEYGIDDCLANVDWGLLNFMQDWFPVEAREKLKANEKEAAEEQMREMGIDPNGCVIM